MAFCTQAVLTENLLLPSSRSCQAGLMKPSGRVPASLLKLRSMCVAFRPPQLTGTVPVQGRGSASFHDAAHMLRVLMAHL